METQSFAVATPVTEQDSTQPVWPTYDHEIGLTEARAKISRFKRANPGQPSAGAMTKVALDLVLQQKDCCGARFYFGHTEDGKMTLVVVGVDDAGNDLDEGVICDHIIVCPPFCPMDSALDS